MSVYCLGVCKYDTDYEYYEDLKIADVENFNGKPHQMLIKISNSNILNSDSVSLFYTTPDNLLNASPTKLITNSVGPRLNPIETSTNGNLEKMISKIRDGYIPICVTMTFTNVADVKTCKVNKFKAIGYLDNYDVHCFYKLTGKLEDIAKPAEKDANDFVKVPATDVSNFNEIDPSLKTKIISALSMPSIKDAPHSGISTDDIELELDSKINTTVKNKPLSSDSPQPLSVVGNSKVAPMGGGGLKRNLAVQTAIPRIYRQLLNVHKTAGSFGPYERRTDYYNYA